MTRKFFYVSPNVGNWKLTYLNTTVFEGHNKQTVIEVGRKLAHEQAPSELVVQNADGTISARETYGNDPFPPRG